MGLAGLDLVPPGRLWSCSCEAVAMGSLKDELLKAIWHAFTALDLDRSGKVSKSQLKVGARPWGRESPECPARFGRGNAACQGLRWVFAFPLCLRALPSASAPGGSPPGCGSISGPTGGKGSGTREPAAFLLDVRRGPPKSSKLF